MRFLILFSLLFSVNAFSAQGNNCLITTQIDFGATTTSAKVSSTNSYRKCLILQNLSASIVYVKFGSAHTGTENLQVGANSRWEPLVIPTGAIWLKSAAGNASIVVIEGR